MNIGIVLHPFNEKAPSGLGTSLFDLTQALIEGDEENTYTLFLKGHHESHPEFTRKNYRVVELGAGLFWLEGLRAHREVDTFLFPMPFLPYLHTPKHSVVIARDFGYRHIPPENIRSWFQNKFVHFMNAWSMRRAWHVVAISEATKKEAVEAFSVKEGKVSVIYNGHRGFNHIPEETVELKDRPFFLTIGVVKERKNTIRSIEAFAEFKKTDTENHVYYFAGKRGGPYYEKIKRCIKENGLEQDVIFLDYLTDGQVAYLYHHARAVVYVSLLEGFGKPILEAMDCGAPLITSDEPPLNEVAGIGEENALLVDPRDTIAIADAIRRIVADTALRERLKENGTKRAAQFSWPKSAIAYKKVLTEA